jgi:hypothetical protein
MRPGHAFAGVVIALLVTSVASQTSNLFWHNLNSGSASETRPACVPFKDTKSERAYWVIDEAPTWVPPVECAWRAVNSTDKPPRTFYVNFISNATQWERPESLAWVMMDRSKPYYINVVSNETTRIVPPEVGYRDDERNATYYKVNDDVTWDAPQEAQWYKAYDEKRKRDYFYNGVTGKVEWVVPAKSNLAWVTWYETVVDPSKVEF